MKNVSYFFIFIILFGGSFLTILTFLTSFTASAWGLMAMTVLIGPILYPLADLTTSGCGSMSLMFSFLLCTWELKPISTGLKPTSEWELGSSYATISTWTVGSLRRLAVQLGTFLIFLYCELNYTYCIMNSNRQQVRKMSFCGANPINKY